MFPENWLVPGRVPGVGGIKATRNGPGAGDPHYLVGGQAKQPVVPRAGSYPHAVMGCAKRGEDLPLPGGG